MSGVRVVKREDKNGRIRNKYLVGDTSRCGVECGQVWEFSRGLVGPKLHYVVVSISRNPVAWTQKIGADYRVYLKRDGGTKCINRSLSSMLKGINCRRIT